MKEGYRIFCHEGTEPGQEYRFYGIHMVKMQEGELRRSRWECEAYGRTPEKLIKDLEKMLRHARKYPKPLKLDEVPEINL